MRNEERRRSEKEGSKVRVVNGFCCSQQQYFIKIPRPFLMFWKTKLPAKKVPETSIYVRPFVYTKNEQVLCT
jgi:hypothetical protein